MKNRKISKEENVKIKLELNKKKVGGEGREVQIIKMNFLLPSMLFFFNFSNFTNDFHLIISFKRYLLKK